MRLLKMALLPAVVCLLSVGSMGARPREGVHLNHSDTSTEAEVRGQMAERGYEILYFVDAWDFFSPSYGCSQNETAHVVVVRSSRFRTTTLTVVCRSHATGLIRPGTLPDSMRR